MDHKILNQDRYLQKYLHKDRNIFHFVSNKKFTLADW